MSDQVKYTQKLKDAHVLIIGGSSGIGYGVAEAVLENGGKVTISSSNPSRVQSAVERLQKAYPSATSRVTGHACGLGDEESLESNVKELFEKVGELDHIVYTAGDALATMTLQDLSMAQLKKAGMVRFFAPLMVAKYGPKYLKQGPESSIVLTTGAVSEKPMPQWAIVGSYAAGLHSMCRGLALDLKPIRVNLISPGAVYTELWDGMPADHKQAMFKSIEEKMPTGRVGQVEDVAEAYLYCMKDKNLTGSMISTNGGALLV